MSFGWATVETTNPLAVRRDGETEPLGVEPDALIAKGMLEVDNRVWCQFHQRRVIILGKAHGDEVTQHGTLSIPVPKTDTLVSTTVTFPHAYSEQPTVIVGINSTVPDRFNYPPTVSNRTATAFTINFYRTTLASTRVTWHAVGRM